MKESCPKGLREKIFNRSGGACELKLAPDCWGWIGLYWGHLCHIKHRTRKANKGTWTAENLLWGCPNCHTYQHNGGKPVPAKGKICQ